MGASLFVQKSEVPYAFPENPMIENISFLLGMLE